MLLESLGTVYEQMQNLETREMFKRALSTMMDSGPPAPWWNTEIDLLLIEAVYNHGYGNYDEMRTDPGICQMYQKSCLELGIKRPSDFNSMNNYVITDWPWTESITKRLKRNVDVLLKVHSKNKPAGRALKEVVSKCLSCCKRV